MKSFVETFLISDAEITKFKSRQLTPSYKCECDLTERRKLHVITGYRIVINIETYLKISKNIYPSLGKITDLCRNKQKHKP